MADEIVTQSPATDPAPPAQPKMPWLLIGGVLLAAWWWEKKFKGKSVSGAIADTLLSDESEDDEDDDSDEEASDVEWTDEPVGRGKLGDIGGPISDTYIAPIKLATNGNCDEAVKLLDKASRQGDQVAGRKKMVVRRALRRSATIVTERCPKEVSDLIGHHEDIRDELAPDVDTLARPNARREFRRNLTPQLYSPAKRTRGEGGRFKRKTKEGGELEYRREGKQAWRVLDLHTGTVARKTVSTGRPRGRPKKLV